MRLIREDNCAIGSPHLWTESWSGATRIRYRGSVINLDQFPSVEVYDEEALLNEITRWARTQHSCFALMIESKRWLIGIADQVRSIPLFYGGHSSGSHLSDSPYALLSSEQNIPWRSDSVREMLLSGYVHGVNTLVENIFTVAAGTIVLFDKTTFKKSVVPYFEYFPDQGEPIPDEELISRWSLALDEVFSGLAQSFATSEVLIPLSGGLDSRLVLAKLVEHGCKNIRTFSYGVKNNSEISTAKLIAKRLGVEWLCLASQTNRLQTLYASEERKKYSRLAGALHITPSTLEYEAIRELKLQGLLNNNPVMINGLSGDFLFGGHIPDEIIVSPTREVAIKKIIDKHVSQIRGVELTSYTESVRARLRQKLDTADIQDGDVQNLCAFIENWDWKERQSKAVMVHQRVYEFFGVDWRLPFWDRRLLSVASKVPVAARYRQQIHQKYLDRLNTTAVFTIPRVKTKLWQGHWRVTPFFVKCATFALGSKARSWCYRKLYYFGYYRHQLGFFGISKFWRFSKIARPPFVVPIATMLYLWEGGVAIERHLDKVDHPR